MSHYFWLWSDTWDMLAIPLEKPNKNITCLIINKIKDYLRYICSNQILVMLLYWHKHIFLENRTHTIHGKRKKVEVWFVKLLIHNQVFHNKLLLNRMCAFWFNFFSQSTFRFYNIYLTVCEMFDRNISNKNCKLFLTLLIQIKKKLCNQVSNSWMLYLSKISPGAMLISKL